MKSIQLKYQRFTRALVFALAIIASSQQLQAASADDNQILFAKNAVSSLSSAQQLTFHNPLRDDGADPFMAIYNNSYYLLVSRQDRINIIKASSLGDLASAPEITVLPPNNNVGNVWAPELHLLNGSHGARWYIYYTAGNRDNFDNQRTYVLESSGTDPLGPYTPKGRIFDQQNDYYAIDGTVLEQNGNLYFLWSGGEVPGIPLFASLYIAPMSNPWTISGSRVQISAPQYDWEKVGAAVNEAPAVLQRDNKIFVTYSASWCVTPDYKLGLLTASATSNLLDPASWTKSPQPVFQGKFENGVYGPGHNSFFKSLDNSEDWIIYHGQSSPFGFCGAGRSTRAQRLTWNQDGTPNFSAPVSLDTDLALPAGESGVTPSNIIPGAAYRLINQSSSLCLDVPFGLPFSGIELQQTLCNGLNPQHWYFSASGNYYNLSAQQPNSNLCLDIKNGSFASGAPVQQWSCNNWYPQRWRTADAGFGYNKLIGEFTNLSLDLADGSSQINRRIVAGANNSQSLSQNWRFERR